VHESNNIHRFETYVAVGFDPAPSVHYEADIISLFEAAIILRSLCNQQYNAMTKEEQKQFDSDWQELYGGVQP
jgi:hypothetical protein